MPKAVCCLALCLTLAGCPTIDEITLSSAEAQALVTNTENAVEVQQLFTKFAFEAARGDLSLVGFSYDPPTVDNGWTGTISANGASFPFGVGDLLLTFTTAGDTGLVDPYTTVLADDAQVVVDVVADFLGTHNGYAVDLSTSFNATTVQNGLTDAVARVNGLFTVDYAGYIADIQAFNVDVTIDLLADEITSVLGNLTAQVDIPNFAFDASVVLNGLGNTVQLGFQVANTIIDYVLNLGTLLP